MLKSDILCCPICKNDLKETKKFLFCKYCKKNYPIKNRVIKIIPNLSEDLELSIKKWDRIYFDQLTSKSYNQEYKNYKKFYRKDTLDQLNIEKKINKKMVYLEIGCGSFFLGQDLADKTKLVIGIDICPSALTIAKKMLDEKGISNYLLIQGDILNLPIKKDLIDLIYGGGVIEHFKNTQKCVNELFRVLKKGGVSFNSVPYLNIGSITYRQLWGNIPNAPILKQMAEFIHIKLLQSRHMTFGYEMSFLASTLKKIHRCAGFNNIKVDKFRVKIVFNFLPNLLKPIFIWLATNSKLFWPMVKVVAEK